jgi:hypothetical protein
VIRQPAPKTAPTTGPLTPLEIGQFSYRDGVWYVQPVKKSVSTKK